MSQFDRGPIEAGGGRTTCSLLGVIKDWHTASNREPVPDKDFVVIEAVHDPFGVGIKGKQIKLFMTAPTKYDANVQMANSIFGLRYGFGPRRPAVTDQIVAFERCHLDEAGDIHACFLKTGGGPRERMEKLAVAFHDEFAIVMPPRIAGDGVKQHMMIAYPSEASVVESISDLEAAIDEARNSTMLPDGRTLGSPGFVLLSRRMPQGGEGGDFFQNPKSRAASIVMMFPQPSSRSTAGRPDFEPMKTSEAIEHIHQGQLAALRRDGGRGWVHEFVPGTAIPMAETAVPSVDQDGRFKGVDRAMRYTVFDRDEVGDIKPATSGFVRSVVLAQSSVRTGSWVATFVTPASSRSDVVPLFDMVTRVTPPGHREACIGEVLRVNGIMRERLAQRGAISQIPRRMGGHQPTQGDNRQPAIPSSGPVANKPNGQRYAAGMR